MKTFATILLAFVVGFATLASAQRIPVGTGGRAGIAGRGENREMLAAMALCTRALGTMRSALPIYQGHRVKAMAATRDAIHLIRQGLQFNRNNRGNAGVDALAVPTADNEPLGRFAREQIQRSNAKMALAARLLNQARERLEAASDDYGGFRNQARDKVLEALREIDAALAIFRDGDGGTGRP